MEKVILDLVKNIYSYAYKKDNKYYSPVSFSKIKGSIALPLDSDISNDIANVKGFISEILSKNIFTATSKIEFLKSIKSEIISSLEMDFNEFINNETEIDNFIKDSEGYLNYVEGETLYVIYSSTDGIKCSPVSMIEEELKADLIDSLYYDGQINFATAEYDVSTVTLAKQNTDIINLISSELTKIIN